MNYNLLLSLFIFMLKLPQISLAGALEGEYSALLTYLSFLEHFFHFQARAVLSPQVLESATFPGRSGSFFGEWYVEAKIWALHVLIVLRTLLLPVQS